MNNGAGRVRRILITGGGTGGHVYPGLAVAEALLSADPGLDIRFAGTRTGIEAGLARKAGYRFISVPASGFRGLGLVARVLFLANFVAGFARSLGLMYTFRPDIVLGTGGYVSAPVLAAALLVGRPCAIQEQNAVPGSVNRLLGKWVRRIYLGFGAAADYFPGRSCRATGNPVRKAFTEMDASRAEKISALAPTAAAAEKEMRLLVFGGSLGARTLNEAVCEAAATWRGVSHLAIWIQTGRRQRDEVFAAFSEFGDRVRVDEFVHEMPAALDWSDLAICRAGAMTLAELAAVGRPSVLVPFPWATDDHQLRNARRCEEAGASVVLEDARCDGPALVKIVAELAADRSRLATMGTAAQKRHKENAASAIAADLLTLTRGNTDHS